MSWRNRPRIFTDKAVDNWCAYADGSNHDAAGANRRSEAEDREADYGRFGGRGGGAAGWDCGRFQRSVEGKLCVGGRVDGGQVKVTTESGQLQVEKAGKSARSRQSLPRNRLRKKLT